MFRAGLIALIVGVFVASAVADRPNLILIMTDDQGYADLSLHGNPQLQTPAMDSIAKDGVQFSRFYVSPVCSPTRASLLTGRYNYRTGVVDTYIGRSMMRPTEVTLAERLRDAGYRTGIFGKWHLGDTWPLRAMDQGFEESLVCRGGGITQPAGPPGNTYFSPRLDHNGVEGPSDGYCSDVFTDAALAYIDAHQAEPFFVYLPYNAPHVPLQIDDQYVQPFREKGLDEDTARVYGMVKNLDDNIARLLARLKDLQLDEKTIVVFLTDNGPAYGDKDQRYTAGLRGRKGQPYEGGIHVPCFVRWKGTLTPGRVVDTPAAHIDLAPTLLDALGVRLAGDAKIDGRSLWAALQGKDTPASPRALFLQWHRGDAPRPFENSAVVEVQYKLVNGVELYDLKADPAEGTDLAASKPEEVTRLRSAYEAWFADVSSAGYDPPRIVLAPAQAPVTILTPQDWRGSADFGPSNASYWEVATIDAGNYDITFDFGRPLQAARVTLRIAGQTLLHEVPEGATELRFEGVALPAGLEDRLAFEVTHQSGGKAVQFATVRKSEGQ